jgi:hypothetical protein
MIPSHTILVFNVCKWANYFDKRSDKTSQYDGQVDSQAELTSRLLNTLKLKQDNCLVGLINVINTISFELIFGTI